MLQHDTIQYIRRAAPAPSPSPSRHSPLPCTPRCSAQLTPSSSSHTCVLHVSSDTMWTDACLIKVGTYLFPRNAHTPQLPQLISPGSRSFRSHLRLRNRFSPGWS